MQSSEAGLENSMRYLCCFYSIAAKVVSSSRFVSKVGVTTPAFIVLHTQLHFMSITLYISKNIIKLYTTLSHNKNNRIKRFL